MQSPYRHRSNPYPYYAQLRSQGPRSFNGVWFLASHTDVTTLLRSPDFSNRTIQHEDAFMAQSLNQTDAPEHGRTRGIIADLFTPRATERLNQDILSETLKLTEALKRNTKIELVSDLSIPLSLGVISNIIGIPEEDRQQILSMYRKIHQSPKVNPSPGTLALRAYFRKAILDPAPNRSKLTILSCLAKAYKEGDLLEAEAIENCMIVLHGGLGAPHLLMSTGIMTLLHHQSQLQTLIDSPELIPQAIEEMLRHQPPVTFTPPRLATKKVQLSTIEIPEGAKVIGLIGAANRDPNIFKDPDIFDIHRRPTKHLSFGTGMHQCIGNFLVRKTVTVALQQLFQSLPTLRLRKGFAQLQPSYTWIRDAKTRGLRHLFVTH